MVANTDPIFGLTANLAEVTFVNADGTGLKDLVSAGANGTKVLSISAAGNDTAVCDIQVHIHDGTTAYLVGTVRIPITAGSVATVPAVDLLAPLSLPWLDADGEFFIPSGYKVQAGPLAAVTAAKTITLVCFAVDY